MPSTPSITEFWITRGTVPTQNGSYSEEAVLDVEGSLLTRSSTILRLNFVPAMLEPIQDPSTTVRTSSPWQRMAAAVMYFVMTVSLNGKDKPMPLLQGRGQGSPTQTRGGANLPAERRSQGGRPSPRPPQPVLWRVHRRVPTLEYCSGWDPPRMMFFTLMACCCLPVPLRN
jgi:hypothetical protein